VPDVVVIIAYGVDGAEGVSVPEFVDVNELQLELKKMVKLSKRITNKIQLFFKINQDLP
jgi:hypothetical protein